MVRLTKLNGESLIVNVDKIEFLEETPDTIITTTTGRKVMIRESIDDVIRLAAQYQRAIAGRGIRISTDARSPEDCLRRADVAREGTYNGR